MDNQDKNLDKPLLDVSNILTPLLGQPHTFLNKRGYIS
jgi:hypothetical protein